jgi:hypothetical protein
MTENLPRWPDDPALDHLRATFPDDVAAAAEAAAKQAEALAAMPLPPSDAP